MTTIDDLLAIAASGVPLSPPARELYTKVDASRVPTLSPCPVCGSPAEMYRYQAEQDGPTTLAGMCSNSEDYEADSESRCPFNLPPNHFYAATIKEAAKYWNGYAKWCADSRAARGAT